MKPKSTRNSVVRTVATLGTLIFTHTAIQAQISTWNGTVASLAAGAWGTVGNWTANGVPNSATAIANLAKDWTGTGPTFTLGADRTLNGLEYEDTGASGDVVGTINAGNILTLAGTTPYVNTLNSIIFNNVIAGTAGLRKIGANTLTLNGASPNISGILNVDVGVVTTGSATALGTMTINFTSADTGRVSFAGGFTYTNPVTVGTGVTGTANVGLINHTGAGGVATLTGTITLSGITTAGGVIAGSNTVGQELRLNGAINQTSAGIGLNQRDGRVIYAGGGDLTGNFSVTSVALIGATNGMPTGLAVTLGGSGNATLDLNGFDQTLAGLTVGNAGASNTATINLGAKTLTLNGNLTSVTPTTQNITHLINATAGSGTLNIGATNRTLTLPDSLALDDMLITGATISGSGGITKVGAGTLALSNVTVAGPLTINAGTLATGRYTAPAAVSATTGSLAFGVGATTLRMKAGPAGDLITTGTLTTAGTTTVTLSQAGGLIPNGTYPLIHYTGTSPGLAGFSLTPFGHAVASLVDTNSAISLKVDGNDSLVWDGTTSGNWVGANGNWKLLSSSSAADYIEGDAVIFNDSPINSDVVIASNVAPSTVTFNNTTATNYTLSGAGGIIGITGLTKTANGLLTISTPNAYTGATTIGAGSVVANFTAGTAIPSASAISVALGTSLTLSHNGGTFALNNPSLTGAGTVTIDPGITTAGARDLGGVTWNASNFTGPLNLAPTTGTMRIQVDNTADIGTGPMTVTTGGQIYISGANLTFPNHYTISGTGYGETTGTLGAIRASSTTTFTGIINVKGSAKIGALGGTALIANLLRKDPDPLVLTGDLTFGGSINNTGGETLAITGDASALTSITVNDGSATSGATSVAVNVGNNTASGTIGAVPVSLNADGFKNAVIRFDRTDGFTLANTVTATSAVAANHIRTYVDADSQGTGFSDGGFAINLGGNLATTGGQFRVGSNRLNSIANLSGALTAGYFTVGAGQGSATANLNSGAVANVGTARVALAGANTTSVLNLNNGSTFNAFSLNLGELNGAIGNVNQAAGSTVNVEAQLRVGHFTTNTSAYNMAGGTLTLTGASPNASPSTAVAGANATYGDNNLNTLATQTIVGGGIYLGNDGCGIFNHTGGTVTTNWMVLDNRGASGAGVNMPDGIDRYNLSGASSMLKLRSTWGLIGRNDGSYAVSLGGGTIQVDNTGTSGTTITTGANITVPLDAVLDTVASTITTLDTNGAGNGFSLTKTVNGTGSLALTGGGTVNLSTTTIQNIAANLSSSGTTANLVKLGTGTTTLAGNMSAFTGNVTVSEGRLNVPASLHTPVTIGAFGTLSGEITLPSLTLDGGTVIFDPNTVGTLAVNQLILNSNSLLDVSAAPGVGPFTALTYSSKSGGGTLSVANGSNYRTPPQVTDNGVSTVSVNFAAGKALTWTGTASGAWDINNTINWTDGAIDEKFFSSDSVIFPTGPTAIAITLTGALAPAGVSVTSDATTNYTFTSTAGNQLTGSTGITKSGASTLTLVGPNAHNGVTTITGGTIAIAADSLGSGVPGNSLALSGGGKLSYTGAVAADLGVNRNIAVGTGGGILEHNNATAATITIPSALSGNGALAFQSTLAGGGTFALTGNNAAYTGAIAVNSVGTGLTTLRIDNTAAAPGGGSITLNYPAAGATGNQTTLTLLGGTTLPASTTIHMTSALTQPVPPATVSLRTQILSTGAVTINSPIKLSGDSFIQIVPPAGSTVTLNGDISEASPGSFTESPLQTYSNLISFRGVGTNIVNGKIILPSAGSTVNVTDGATTIINSTGNEFKSAHAAYGTLRIGSATAIPSTARLVIGQAGNQSCTLDLNGFDQTVSGLEWQATSAATTKGVSNTHPTATSTFTINQLAAPAANFSGAFTGAINLVKEGTATTTLATGLSTFTGSVTVNAGTLVASGIGANNGANSALGVANVAGRTITVNNPGTVLSFTINNVFGNGNPNPNLPTVIVNGGTLAATRYNVLGNLTLNAGTLDQSSTDAGGYFGYHFRGNITVGGAAASTISTGNGQANHLSSNVTFTVADATANSAADLVVSAPLSNQSADFASAAGALTKDGLGTMVLSGINTYTGNTTVNAGTLELADNAQLRFVLGATSGINNSLSGTGAIAIHGDFVIDTTAAAALTAGSWLLENVTSHTGPYGATFQVLNPDGSPWASSGEKWTKAAAVGSVWTFDETTGILTLGAAGYDAWASQIPDVNKRARTDDPDGDGFNNGLEFLFGTSPIAGNGLLVTVVKASGNLTLQWLQRETGAAYLVQESATMGIGTWMPNGILVPALDDQTGVPTDYDRYKVIIPMGTAKNFYRIRGTEN